LKHSAELTIQVATATATVTAAAVEATVASCGHDNDSNVWIAGSIGNIY